jgi:hypothetical protein
MTNTMVFFLQADEYFYAFKKKPVIITDVN